MNKLNITAKILLDSITEGGSRLTTWEWTYPRAIHAEIMTHRALCLAGDSRLEFDMPAGHHGDISKRRVHSLTIADFVEKWLYGSAPHRSRWGTARTFDLKGRLREMRIRQLNEATGGITTSTVVDAQESGIKPVYEVTAGKYHVAGSADHRVMTDTGWKPIGDLHLGDLLVVSPIKKPEALKKDPLYSGTVPVDSIRYRGIEPTYDLTIAGPFPNFLANKVVVHNSRNSASSRAIPAAKLRERTRNAPFMPIEWGANQKGMQAECEIDDTALAEDWWLRGLEFALRHHQEGEELGLHKQIVNRVIEPYMAITVIVSATDNANLFHLRKHKDAEPHFRRLATLCWDAYHESLPTEIDVGGWHLPMITSDDLFHDPIAGSLSEQEKLDRLEILRKISVGRCARVSYLTHDGRRDVAEDVALHDRLAATASLGADPMHASPFEHVAMAVGGRQRIANFEGWRQYRKFFPAENGPDTSDRCVRCGCWGSRHSRGCERTFA